jgi:Mycolic acid cyclopropane synthetase
MSDTGLYRDFYYPLNVFMHILTHEEGTPRYLHYGLFEGGDESIAAAQERSTELLLSHLPPPPARLLDVGAGLGTMLARLTRSGYDAEGITPDEQQIAMIRSRYGDELRVTCSRFEDFPGRPPYDALLFQESSQYIGAEPLFAKASEITRRVLVLDEFAAKPIDARGALHDLPGFLAAAIAHGFRKTEEIDVSQKAAPTIAYFTQRIPKYREALIADLGLASIQLEDLIESGNRYRELYANGTYVYRLLEFSR